MIRGKRILFCVSNLGLGHATRSLALIRHYGEANKIFILSNGKALDWLRQATQDLRIQYFDFKDYPSFARGSGLKFYYKLAVDLLSMFCIMRHEKKFTDKLVRDCNIDLIFSDFRYGGYSEQIPSFVI